MREDGGDTPRLAVRDGPGVAGAEVASDLTQEGIAGGGAEVAGGDGGGVLAAACSTRDDDGQRTRAAEMNEQGLLAGVIDGVDDEVGREAENRFGSVCGEEVGDDLYAAARSDGGDAVAHGLDLRSPVVAHDCVNLPVGVGHTDLVEVDEDEAAYAGSGERLDGPRANAADADDHHRSSGDPVGRGVAVESSDTAESFVVLGLGVGHAGCVGWR